ncbi:short-chain dehydrogenase [Azospirillum sp. TSH100]|uniref:SDR family oxidoreductase n=1 Tax=Azospirillum sp. TSH100 TaxID=652764 RepID=UPI000D61B1CE|nr:SDR family oxidoreductase [Azospirillum sp. TSH100]PWC81992.1 short-chain dehydrogenase [Azospirillum sp. TSH100]QCG88114.1 SDR family oxidoreductase [Azospirillum sp. TSH100]
MGQLDGKTAIITGASSGIGRETALLFAEHGAKLVLVARRHDELERLANRIRDNGGQAVAVAGSVADAVVASEAVQVATHQFGGLDIAFNNAGTTGAQVPLPEMTAENWHEVIETNLTSAFHAAKQQIPALLARGGGSLIFTSTFVGHTVGFPGMAAYAASKAGLIGLMQVIAAEYGQRGIRANALLPGGTDTPMGRAVSNTPEALAFVQGLHALKRLAKPREIAQSALYLASGMSSFTTGTALLVDGGVSITRT